MNQACRLLLLILCASTTTLLADPSIAEPCMPGYTVDLKAKEVWYHKWDEDLKPKHIRMQFVDAPSFTSLIPGSATGCQFPGRFGKDKKSVYFEGKRLRNGDPTSVTLIAIAGGAAAQSDTGFLFSNNKILFEECVLENADRATFKVDRNGLAHDKTTIYAGCRRLPSTGGIRALNSSYFVVGENLYFKGAPIAGASAKTFTALSENYGRDGAHLFYKDQVLNHRDGTTFALIDASGRDERYTKDKSGVFYGNKMIVGADPVTFKLLPANQVTAVDPKICAAIRCYVDKERIYVEDLDHPSQPGAVGASEVVSSLRKDIVPLAGGFLRFGPAIFYGNTILSGVDSKSFVVLDDYGFAKDKKYIYCKQQITHFDPGSFGYWPRMETACGSASRYVKDKAGVYLISGCDPELVHVLEKADKQTFAPAGKPGCAQDNKSVFRCGAVVNSFSSAASCGLK